MHFAHLVKQACVDLVSDLFVYYRLGCEPFVCSWGLHNSKIYNRNVTTLNLGKIIAKNKRCRIKPTTTPYLFQIDLLLNAIGLLI